VEISRFLKICNIDKLKFGDFTFEYSELLGCVGSYSEAVLPIKAEQVKLVKPSPFSFSHEMKTTRSCDWKG
jgi:hypothetical protein